MIPGINLLNIALTAISPQTVAYYQATGRVLNSVGQYVTQFAPPVNIVGSFQPVTYSTNVRAQDRFSDNGLDYARETFTLHTSDKTIVGLARNISGDQIVFEGKRYQCESSDRWRKIDGWVSILCILITSKSEVAAASVFGFGTSPPTNNNKNFDNGGFIE